MVNTFVPTVQALFQSQIVSEAETKRGGNFLIGVKDKLFEVQGDYSVLEPKDGYTAIGCGEVAAMGSLYSTTKNNPKMSARDHIVNALEAAEKNYVGVHRPFVIVNTKNEEVEIID